MHVSIGCAALFVSMVGNLTAQAVSPDDVFCKNSGGLMITVTDSSGGHIPNAFVLFRADLRGTLKSSKDFVLERRTDSTGKVVVSVPCGLLDLFVAADGFTPHSEKIVIRWDGNSVSVKLDLYPITYTD